MIFGTIEMGPGKAGALEIAAGETAAMALNQEHQLAPSPRSNSRYKIMQNLGAARDLNHRLLDE